MSFFGLRRKKTPTMPAALLPLKASPSLPDLERSLSATPAFSQSLASSVPGGLADLSGPSDEPPATPAGSFRRSPSEGRASRAAVNSLYAASTTSHAPSAYRAPGTPSGAAGGAPRTRSLRRSRLAPPLNVLVAGARGTGKTALVRLLLDTLELSSGATAEQRAAASKAFTGAGRRTMEMQGVKIEVLDEAGDRVMLSLTDAPGLSVGEPGSELELEREVNGILRYIEGLYGETLKEESKVVRSSASLSDNHIHLVVYLLSPSSITYPSLRSPPSSHPLPRSTFFLRTPSTVSNASSANPTSPPTPPPEPAPAVEKQEGEELSLHPSDLRTLQRLAKRVNVLPVIARADELSDAHLARVKDAVRRDLARAGVGFGVFAPAEQEPAAEDGNAGEEDGEGLASGQMTPTGLAVPMGRNGSNGLSTAAAVAAAELSPPPTPPKLIRIRSRHKLNGTSRSGSRRPSTAPTPIRTEPEAVPDDGSASPSSLLPFAIVAPERTAKSTTTRSYRWGAVDVLDPAHCDFPALKEAVLGGEYQKVLKTQTREVLYETYRREVLLANEAARQMTPKEQQRLFQELGVPAPASPMPRRA